MMNNEQRISDTPKQRVCDHVRHDKSMAEAKDPKPMPLCYFREIMQKLEDAEKQHDDCTALKFNFDFNHLYLSRLEEIENLANNDFELKIVTYQEWVDCLLHMNKTILHSLLELESKVEECLEQEQKRKEMDKLDKERQKLLAQHDPQLNLLKAKSRDLERLLALMHCAYHNNTWSIKGLKFETIDPKALFKTADLEHSERTTAGSQDTTSIASDPKGVVNKEPPPSVRFSTVTQTEKMDQSALVQEVAEKHDEILELKKQINSLEMEIQNAQKKIQLKDTVIKELRSDLKNNGKKNDQTNTLVKMQVDTETIENELNQEFFIKNLEKSRDNISAMLKEAFLERKNACDQLERVAFQLAEIERLAKIDKLEDLLVNDSSAQSAVDKLILSVCERLQDADKQRFLLEKTINELKVENDEIKIKFENEKTCSSRYHEILKEIADVLSKLTGRLLTYEQIFDTKNTENPFVDSIFTLAEIYAEKYEKQLQNFSERKKSYKAENETLKCQNEELQKKLLKKESEIFELNLIVNKTTDCVENESRRKSRQKDDDEERERLTRKNKKLHKELEDTKNKNVELTNEMNRLKISCSELIENHKKLQETNCTQINLLQTSQAQLTSLQERYEDLQRDKMKLETNHEMQVKKITFLNHRLAELEGKNNSLQEQVKNAMKELYIKDCLYKAEKSEYEKKLGVAKEGQQQLKLTLNQLMQRINELTNSYKMQLERAEIQQQTINCYKQWEEEQLGADRTISEGMKKYEEHIKLLLMEKANCLDKLKKLERDNDVLHQQIMRSSGSSNSGAYHPLEEFSIQDSFDKFRLVKESLDAICNKVYGRSFENAENATST